MHDVLNTKAIHAANQHPWPRRESQPTPACYGKDPELWFPETVEAYDEAVAICKACPLQALCREVAEARGEHGVWGGVLFVSGRPLPRFPVPGRPKQPIAA